MIGSKIYKNCMNVERCEMCRPDTHALGFLSILDKHFFEMDRQPWRFIEWQKGVIKQNSLRK